MSLEQINIFNNGIMNFDIMEQGAVFSKDRKYRYVLTRIWDRTKSLIMFIGLNPSTANEKENDPTIRRCIGFAKAWGYGGIYMMNLYSYVSTNPKDLLTNDEDLEYYNDKLLKTASLCDKIIFAWGTFKEHKSRMDEVIKMFPYAYCIKKSKEGYPCHPLYLKGDLKPVKFD